MILPLDTILSRNVTNDAVALIAKFLWIHRKIVEATIDSFVWILDVGVDSSRRDDLDFFLFVVVIVVYFVFGSCLWIDGYWHGWWWVYDGNLVVGGVDKALGLGW